MHNLAKLALLAILVGAPMVGGCSSTPSNQTGTAGAGAATGVGGGAGTESTVTGEGGEGGSTGGTGTPQEIHDGLLNAPTTGAIDVMRAPPTIAYPACQ